MWRYLPLLLSLVACSSPTATWSLDESWSPEEREIILAAAQEWCEASEGTDCLPIDGGESPIQPLAHASGFVGLYEPDVRQGVSRISVVLFRERDDWRRWLYLVARHEIGHALGCWGDWPDEEPNAMTQYVNDQDLPITERDLQCVREEIR